MLQAALKKNNKDKKECSSRKNDKACFAGIICLLSVLCALFTIVWMVLSWIEDTQQFLLSKLVITGERRYTRDNDIFHSILAFGTPGTLITQDINIIRNKIERYPWIKQVNVRRQWPDKLSIHIIEYVPIACWNNQQMIDVNGNSFRIPLDRISSQDLPILYGPDGSEDEVLHGFNEISQMLSRHRFMLKEVVMKSRRSWQLTLMNGIKLNLGRRNIMERLSRFIELYPVLLQQVQIIGKQISYIDLRYDTGVAIGWNPISVEEPNQQ